mmetsp:Transcript_69695/g.167299  ORF Transcript_69695/g.167299 Transcript_69695/m.167299 type:complete len:412 (+) Transcript_69695:89-1324(+)|eukprot:CAMPEP_0178397006 /NCGR_PEP_ID=MMETSP0689_2-20121128/14022_1 /TAXON_ID=160604 /ORGANISM="Amphidinium massartii, Strain CS-259" /LENGTH=411 /DNA_ID=CAMNT_0020017699 /DNA_START=20 /DNA_END=1255 /DNA_ORIENTATION=+
MAETTVSSITNVINNHLKPSSTVYTDASLTVVLGVALVLTGLVGLPTYFIMYCIPTGVLLLCSLIVAGLALTASEVYIDDKVFFGMSISQLLAAAAESYRDGWSRFALLMSLTDSVKANDVQLVYGRRRPITAPMPVPYAHLEASRTQEAFHTAVLWLKRPVLTLSYEQQLRLLTLYKQAVDGVGRAGQGGAGLADGPAPVEHAAEAAGEVQPLPTAANGSVANGHVRAELLQKMPPKVGSAVEARRLLPAVLAEVDPAFAAASGHLAVAAAPSSNNSVNLSLTALSMRLLLQRLPATFDEKVHSLHNAMFLASIVPLVSIFRWAPRRYRLSRMFALMSSTYLAVLCNGVPSSCYALLRRLTALVSRPRICNNAAGGGHELQASTDPMVLLGELFGRLLAPRVSPPLMLKK